MRFSSVAIATVLTVVSAVTTTHAVPPFQPSPIQAYADSTSQIRLAWEYANSSSTDTFEIFRDGVSYAFTQLHAWTDVGLLPGTAHQYYVIAHNAEGSGPPSQALVATTRHNDLSFVYDGQIDFSDYYVSGYNDCDCSGLPPNALYAAVRGTKLYLATNSPGAPGQTPNDRFIIISDVLDTSHNTPAPWAKFGTIAVPAGKPFVGVESTNSFIGWFNADSVNASSFRPAGSGGYVEAIIDLVQAFGYLPDRVYAVVAAYQTGDGGWLVVPQHNDPSTGYPNLNIEASDFVPIDLVAWRDENSDGVLDQADLAINLKAMVARNPDYTTTVTVPAVPHRVYYFARATNVTDQFQTYGNRGAELGDTSVNFLFGTTQSNTHAFFKVTLTDP